MSRPSRDLRAERAAIQAAAARLLAGTPLRSPSGTLSATGLITESGLARWKVYEHRDLVEGFQARVHAQDAVPEALLQMKADNKRLAAELAETTAALAAERARTALLRRALAEASIELELTRQDAAGNATVIHLPATRRPTRARPGPRP